jgi:hypothetical protein
MFHFLCAITHGFGACAIIIMWFKGGLSIFKVMSKRTYSIDVVKDYGKVCLANTNYLCYNKHHVWSMDVQDQMSIFVNNNWVPQHTTIGLIETPNISQTTLAKIVKPFFNSISIHW